MNKNHVKLYDYTVLPVIIIIGRGSTEVIETLHRQNNDLREVIGHMRSEMDKVAEPTKPNDEDTQSIDPRYKTNRGIEETAINIRISYYE